MNRQVLYIKPRPTGHSHLPTYNGFDSRVLGHSLVAALELNPRIYKRYQKRTLKYHIFNMNHELVARSSLKTLKLNQSKIHKRTSPYDRIPDLGSTGGETDRRTSKGTHISAQWQIKIIHFRKSILLRKFVH